jgi:hypothetical protein
VQLPSYRNQNSIGFDDLFGFEKSANFTHYTKVDQTMNFKSIGLGLALAVVAATTTLSASADAATLNFTGTARLKNANATPVPGATSILDFLPFQGEINSTTVGTGKGTITAPTDSVFGNVGDQITLKDLKLTRTESNTWTLASVSDGVNFITGLAGGATFSLETFVLKRIFSPSSNAPLFVAEYTGFFSNFDQIGVGVLTPSSGQAFITRAGTSYSSGIAVVPTPALLPGLIGMGAAALRKKRKEEGLEATPEAVEVNA